MKRTLLSVPFLFVLFTSCNTFALTTLPHVHSDTFAEFGSTTFAYDATTDTFTIDMAGGSPSEYFLVDGTWYEIFDSHAAFSAIIDSSGYLSSGSLTWYGTVPTIPGINFDGNKIVEATVNGANFGTFPIWGPGFQFEFDVTNSNVDFGSTGAVNLFGLWPGVGSGGSPWESSYSGHPYTYTDLIFLEVPEPSNFALLGLGLALMMYLARRKQDSSERQME